MSRWVKYRNGNYDVYIDLDTGTKIRKNDLDNLTPSHPESMDLKITNKCHHGCKMCHENSTPEGAHGDILNLKFIDTLLPYTEIAIGGGNPLEHPDLEAFLVKCKSLKLIPSMTVHQSDFLANVDLLRRWRDEELIWGIGVSVSHVTDELIETLQEFPNAVCHIIAGIASETVIHKLANNNLKVLILGYKVFRRGEVLWNENADEINFLIQYMYDVLPDMVNNGWFNTVSFDNLAIEQLKPSRLLTDKQYEEFYMGDDGDFTLYIDAVNNEFAQSSTATQRFPLRNDIKEIFEIVKQSKNR